MFEYPKASGMHANFSNFLWVAAKNKTSGELHLAISAFSKNEFWPGPVDSNGHANLQLASSWNKIWKVSQSDIDSFRRLSNPTLINIPKPILEWPGTANPYAKSAYNSPLTIPNRKMAPFVDVNGDGKYNALHGDYPLMKGDQMLWWIMNDVADFHLLSMSMPLGIEIMASAYACSDQQIEDVIFLDIDISNQSSNDYDSTVIGLFSAGDLGNFQDDFIGFDSSRRIGIMYNADAYDEGFGNYGYNIPQIGAMLLHAPGDKNFYFEPVGTFMQIIIYSDSPLGFPTNSQQFFYSLTARLLNGQYVNKGCDPLAVGAETSPYFFPGDPQIMHSISEPQCASRNDDRSFLLASKPFDFNRKSTVQVSYAFLAANMGGNPYDFKNIRFQADFLEQHPYACTNKNMPADATDVFKSAWNVYPNPSSNNFTIEIPVNTKLPIHYSLYNLQGQKIIDGQLNELRSTLFTQPYPKGMYLLKLKDCHGISYDSKMLEFY